MIRRDKGKTKEFIDYIITEETGSIAQLNDMFGKDLVEGQRLVGTWKHYNTDIFSLNTRWKVNKKDMFIQMRIDSIEYEKQNQFWTNIKFESIIAKAKNYYGFVLTR